MNRLLARLRPGEKPDGTNGASARHVRVIGSDRGGRSSKPAYVVTAAETAPCTCPDFCERDHANE